MQEVHYDLDPGGNPIPLNRIVNTYGISIDYHARSTSYAYPVQVDHSQRYESDFQPLRRATSSYDSYGCPLSIIEWMWDKTKNAWIKQNSHDSTYVETSWGGELLENEAFVDYVTGFERNIAYGLTSDQRNFASSTVTYKPDSSLP